ncbi:MAG: NUDIX domain-containing protein [Bacteroidota bacterium]
MPRSTQNKKLVPEIAIKDYYLDADRLLLAVDCIIFGFDRNSLKLLLFQRKVAPFQAEWSLIGSFVKKEESVQKAAERVLETHTGLTNVFMEELGSYSSIKRDPGDRVISIAHYALMRLEEKDEKIAEEFKAHWFDFDQLPDLVMDHHQMVQDALEKLRRKARYRPIGFELLPEKFTIPQLRLLYEVIYQRELDRRNFRKKILSMNILEKLEEKDKTSSRKGAFLYRFIPAKYEEMVEKGVDFVI